MPVELLIAVVGLTAAAIGYIVKALVERRSLNANAAAAGKNADSTHASATAVVIAAARELVDPLRRELATERAERIRENEAEQEKFRQVRAELHAALEESRMLRIELDKVRHQMEAMEAALLARIVELQGGQP